MIAESQLIYVLGLLATGMFVGFFCGLLGVGGGFIMVPVQIWALTSAGIESTLATRIAFGTSLAVILPTALCGCHGHSCRGVVLWRPGIALGLSGLVGAFLGGTFATRAPGDLLKMIFGLVVLLGALRMIFTGMILDRETTRRGEPKESLPQCFFWGLSIGAVSGICGIGGGVILIPIMVIAFNFSILQAIGTSSIIIALNAVGGVLAYVIHGWGVAGLSAYSLGYIDLLQFVLLAGTSIFTASLGVKAAHKLPAEKIRYIFVILMMYIGLRMIGVFSWLGFGSFL